MREALGGGLSEIFFSAPDASLTMVLSTTAFMHEKAAGYPPSIRYIMQIICHGDKRPFVATVP